MAEIILNPMFNSMSGRIGKIVLYRRMNKQCARIYVVPRNPDTATQKKNRASFSDAVASWQSLSIEEKLFWNSKARIKRRRGYNLYISEYMKGKIEAVDYLPVQACEAEESSSGVLLPVSSCAATVPLRCIKSSSPLAPVCSFFGDGIQPVLCLRE